MTRDIRGKAVKSREPEHEGTKSKPAKASPGTGGPKDVAGDKIHNPDTRRSAKAFDGRVQDLESHHDRLCKIEEHIGLHHWSDDMKSQDQKAMGPRGRAKIAGHITEKKGNSGYGRKHH